MKVIIKTKVVRKNQKKFNVCSLYNPGKAVLLIDGVEAEFSLADLIFLESADNIDKALDGELMVEIERKMLKNGDVLSASPARVAELLGYTESYCEECLDFHNYEMPHKDWLRLNRRLNYQRRKAKIQLLAKSSSS